MNEHDSPNYNRVWFIGESSTCVGRALAEAVLARGERAVIAARMPERVRDFIERYPAQALVLELDVTRRQQLRGAVAQARDHFGRIDVLVNSADRSPEALVEEFARLGINLAIVEPARAGDPVRAAEDLIAAVSAQMIPRK